MKTNYIQQAYKGMHEWWRYLIGVIIAIIGVTIFSMPHLAAITIKQLNSELDMSKMDDTNYILSLFEPNLNLFFMLLPFAGGLLFLLLTVKILHKQPLVSLATSRKKIDWKRVFSMFFVWGMLSSGLVLLDYYMNPDGYMLNFDMNNFLILCVIAIALVPLQTSFEEYLFRGYLMQGLGVSSLHKKFPFVLFYSIVSIILYILLDHKYNFGLFMSFGVIVLCVSVLTLIVNSNKLRFFFKSQGYLKIQSYLEYKWVPLILTSSVFGLLHIANPEVDKLGYIIMVYYIGTGLFLGIMTLMDEGLELALGFHAANNLFTALLVTADWTAFQTHSILKDTSEPTGAAFMDIFMPVFIVFPIILLILSRVYGWKNWKNKLFGKIEEPPKEDYKIIE